ncbi:MAG: acetate/propionate family kinase, partial [Burkholderiales bacterium]
MLSEKQSAESANYVLAVNGGSSSIKFALYQTDDRLTRRFRGKIDRIGLPGTSLSVEDATRNQQESSGIEVSSFRSAAEFLLDWLEKQVGFASVSAVGHRVVHGMKYTEPQRVTRELMDELHRISQYDPEHLPCEIELIETFHRRHSKLPQVACFDTAFHRTMPRVARLLPIPRRYDAMGIQRYGFHGLSYSYLMEELARVAGAQTAQGKVILAHLGNGASLAAVRDGKSVDTSMGFTPAAGLPMGTRPGDLDPGVARYLIQVNKLTPEQFNTLINHESGLLGVSETSSDMRDLLERQESDIRCAEAVELFCYQTSKWIGAFAVALGGLETLVFAGGIGESAGEVRARICNGLVFLGVELDERRNAGNAAVISVAASRVTVRVIKTDEELVIVRAVCHILRGED